MGEGSVCAQGGAPLQPEFRFCAACGARVTEPNATSDNAPVLPGDRAEDVAASLDATGTGVAAGGGAGDDSGPIAPVLAEPEPGTSVLVVTKGPSAGERFELVDQTLTAGRSEDNTIFLDDITVSRHHARLEHVDDAWTITDLGSLNGTYVNKEAVESRQLANGDEVQIGKYRFQFLSMPSA